jgi:hypothetical protein
MNRLPEERIAEIIINQGDNDRGYVGKDGSKCYTIDVYPLLDAQLAADQAVCANCSKVKELEKEIKELVYELSNLNMRPVLGGKYPEWAMSDKAYQALKSHYLEERE